MMQNDTMKSIFDQINNLSTPSTESQDIIAEKSDAATGANLFKSLLASIAEEIQRVLDQSNLTQEDLCKLTGMSQSNISKIQNGKVTPRIETLQKIASATHTRLVIGFENIDGDE
mgnify:CR=1 FL=1